MSSMQTSIEAVRKSLVVECSPERAFEVFTREVGSWWPLHEHSIGGKEITEVIWEERVGGRIYERHADGGEGEWGRVLAWDPPARFVDELVPGQGRLEGDRAGGALHGEGQRDARRPRAPRLGDLRRGGLRRPATTTTTAGPTVLGYFESTLNG